MGQGEEGTRPQNSPPDRSKNGEHPGAAPPSPMLCQPPGKPKPNATAHLLLGPLHLLLTLPTWAVRRWGQGCSPGERCREWSTHMTRRRRPDSCASGVSPHSQPVSGGQPLRDHLSPERGSWKTPSRKGHQCQSESMYLRLRTRKLNIIFKKLPNSRVKHEAA